MCQDPGSVKRSSTKEEPNNILSNKQTAEYLMFARKSSFGNLETEP